jgi:hypothetical protein
MKTKTRHSKKTRKPNILDPLVVSIVDPKGTAIRLIKPNAYPPYSLTTLIAFMCVVILPTLLYGPIYFNGSADLKLTYSVILTTLLTIFITITLTSFMAHASNVQRPFGRVLAAIAYSTAPVTVIFATLLLASKIFMGNLPLLMFISTGTSLPYDKVNQIFPFALRISLVISLFNLAQSLSVAARGGLGLGVVMAILTIPVILGSFVMGLWLTELIYPGASVDAIAFFTGFMAYPK